jgi:predicted MFS family arabinose efflux permease
VFYNLVSKVGFGWAIRVIAFIMLFLSFIPLLGMRMLMKPPAARKLFDAKAWAEPEYTLYVAALTVGYLGIYVPYFYIQLYCQEKAIVSIQLDIYLVPVMNAAGFFGRFVSLRLLSPGRAYC